MEFIKLKNEWQKFFGYDNKLQNIKNFIKFEIFVVFFVLLTETVLLLISTNNNIFNNKYYYLYLSLYFLSWILSIFLGFLNKRYQQKWILLIALLFHPRFWGMTFFMGIVLINSFFELNFYISILIFFFYILSFIIIFFDYKKIQWFTDIKNNNLLKSLLTLLFFAFILIGNTRYVIRFSGISQNGIIRLIIGCFMISYYFIIQSVSNIMVSSSNNV